MVSKKTSKPPRKRGLRRKLLRFSWASIVVFVIAFPWWSILLVKPLARSLANMEIERIETSSWDRWMVSGASMNSPAFDLSIETLECPSASGMIAALLFGQRDSMGLDMVDWDLSLHDSRNSRESDMSGPTPFELLQIVDQSLDKLQNYAGPLNASNGQITRENVLLANIHTLVTGENTAQARFSTPAIASEIELTLDRSSNGLWSIQSKIAEKELHLEFDMATSKGAIDLDGTFRSSGNVISVMAHWTDSNQDFVPDYATLSSDTFALDSRYDFWNAMPDLPLAVECVWENGEYSYRIEENVNDERKQSALIRGGGSLRSLVLDEANIALPWIVAKLDSPLRIDLQQTDPFEDARFDLNVELDRIPWFDAHGLVHANVISRSDADGYPVFDASLKGEDVRLFNLSFNQLNAKISSDLSSFRIDTLELDTTDGSHIEASGELDPANKTIEAFTVQARIQKDLQHFSNMLPVERWNRFDITAEVNGSLDDPSIELELTGSQLEFPMLHAMDLELRFEGSLSSSQTSIKASRNGNLLTLSAGLSREDQNAVISVQSLKMAQESPDRVFTLENPFGILIDPSASIVNTSNISLYADPESWIRIEAFELAGDSLSLDLKASSLAKSLVQPWLQYNLPNIEIGEIAANLDLDENGGAIALSGFAKLHADAANTIEAFFQLHQTNGAFEIGQLEIGSNGQHFLKASGAVPISLSWVDNAFYPNLNQTSPFNIQIESLRNPGFWRALESFVPVAVTQPVINATLSGTLEAPAGSANVQLDSLVWKHHQDLNRNIRFSDIEFSLAANETEISIDSIKANIGGNRIEAFATLPLGDLSIADYAEKGFLPDLKKATGYLQAKIGDLGAIDFWLPEFVREESSGSLELRFSPGNVDAVLRVDNLATRPLPPLGSLSQIEGVVQYENGVLRTNGLRGLAEQSPFLLSGSTDLNDPAHPVFDLAFASDSFPLARDTSVLITGDVDLSLRNDGNANPALSGTIELTKGLILAEPDLLASSTTTNTLRPPYFSVEQEPFRTWALDIDIKGDRFLRVSNSFFQGTLSSEFRLEGVMGSPLLTGRTEVVNGIVYFPASSFRLSSGTASITRDNPTDIQIEAIGTGRIYGYDTSLCTSGTLDAPDVAITTSPALTPAEALLLVTAGTLPDASGGIAQQSATSLGVFIGKGLFKKLLSQGDGGASRISIDIGKDVSLQGKKTVEARYEISEEVEIEGEYDKRDEYNANLIWTFFKK